MLITTMLLFTKGISQKLKTSHKCETRDMIILLYGEAKLTSQIKIYAFYQSFLRNIKRA